MTPYCIIKCEVPMGDLNMQTYPGALQRFKEEITKGRPDFVTMACVVTTGDVVITLLPPEARELQTMLRQVQDKFTSLKKLHRMPNFTLYTTQWRNHTGQGVNEAINI